MVKCGSVIALHFQGHNIKERPIRSHLLECKTERVVAAHAHASVVHVAGILNRGSKKPCSHCQNYLFQQVPGAPQAGLGVVAWCTNQPNFRSSLSSRHHKAHLFPINQGHKPRPWLKRCSTFKNGWSRHRKDIIGPSIVCDFAANI